jgi:hypothetical protein
MSDPSSDRHADGRYAKGHPGGPGRPRNPVSTAAQELDRLGVEVARELMRVIVERARTGNLKAAEMVLQRIWPVRRNRPIELEIPFGDAALPNLLGEHANLAEAMMDGHITPQDAEAATRVFKALQDQAERSARLMRPPRKWESPPKSA